MAITVGTLNAVVSADISQLKVNLARATAQINGFAASTNKKLAGTSSAFGVLGKTIKVTMGAAAVATGVATVSYAKFDDALRKGASVQAASEEQLRSMGDTARQLAKDLNLSANSIAASYFDLGSAGLSSADQLKVVIPVAKQAKAANIELEQSSKNLVETIKSFKLDFSQASNVIDIFSKANSQSVGKIGEFGEAIRNVGSLALKTNNDLEQTVAVLAFMSDVGLRGSKAGIILRRSLANLSAPTSEVRKELDKWVNSYDEATGKMKPFSMIMDELIGKLKGASEEQQNMALKTIFGVRAITGMTEVMSRGEGSIEAFADSLRNAGGATDEIINRQLKSFVQKLGMVQKAANDALITLGELTGTKIASGFDGLVTGIENINTKMKENSTNIKKVIDFFGTMFKVGKSIFTVLSKTISTITIRIVAAIKAIGDAVLEIPEIMKLAGKAIGNFGKNFVNVLDQLVTRWDDFVNAVFSFSVAGIKDVFSEPLDTSGFDESTEKTLSQLGARFQSIVDDFEIQNEAAFFAIADLWAKAKKEVESNPITPKIGGNTSTTNNGEFVGTMQPEQEEFIGPMQPWIDMWETREAIAKASMDRIAGIVGSVTQTMAGIFQAGFQSGFDGMLNAFKNVLIQMAAQLAASVAVRFLASIFGVPTGAGGIFGGIGKILGFQNGGLAGGLGLASGGLTSSGAKMVAINENSKPEFVVNAGQTAANLPLLEAINSGNGSIVSSISRAIESGLAKQDKYIIEAVNYIKLARGLDKANAVRSTS